MATETEIAEVAQNVVADEATLALLADLRKQGGKVCDDAASLIEWFIDTQADYVRALAEARDQSRYLAKRTDVYIERLGRIHDHLQGGFVHEVMNKLADYAGGIGYDDPAVPPPDPWPDTATQGNGS